MQQDSSIQTERNCRSRVYGVFPTYSLRGCYKGYSREVDREKFLLIPWGEREEDLNPLNLEEILDLHTLEPSIPHFHSIWLVGSGNHPREGRRRRGEERGRG
jgi:hypothetical protein